MLSLLFLLPHLHCMPSLPFCFHLHCHFILFVSASKPALPFSTALLLLPKPALPSLLFLLPHLYFISTAAAYPNLHFHLYCSWLPSLLFLILHLRLHLFCFCSHTCITVSTILLPQFSTSMSTASSPTPPILCPLPLLPHLQFHLHCFCIHT